MTLLTAFAAMGATEQSDSQTSDVVNIREGVTLFPGSNATQYLTVTLAGARSRIKSVFDPASSILMWRENQLRPTISPLI